MGKLKYDEKHCDMGPLHTNGNCDAGMLPGRMSNSRRQTITSHDL